MADSRESSTTLALSSLASGSNDRGASASTTSTANNDEQTTSSRGRGFTRFTSICFTVNYLVGTGFLTLPWAFQQGGILLSTFTIVGVVIVCNASKNYVLTAMARAEVLTETPADSGNLDDDGDELELMLKNDEHYGSTIGTHLEVSSPRLARDKSKSSDDDVVDDDAKQETKKVLDLLIVKDRKFEYTDLCHMFLGVVGKRAYVGCVTIAISLQLWGYAAVFGLGMAEYLPLGKGGFDADYKIYILLFGLVAVPMSCLELKEQVGFQVFLSVCRFLVIFLMVQTVRAATRHGDEETVYFTDSAGSRGDVKLVDFSGFYAMFSILMFTAMFHNGIPVLAEPVGDRRKLSQNFRDAIVIVCGACWVLGASVAYYFGDAVEQSSNLNWNTYVGGTGRPSADGSGTWLGVALWPRMVATFVVLFPPVNMISVYPLNAIVLGNNLLIGFRGSSSSEEDRLATVAFRLLGATPPIFGAFFVKELGIITSYSGILSIITVLLFPALLYLSSKKAVENRGIFCGTYYDGFGSSVASAYAVLALSVVASVYILTELLFG